MRIIAGEARGRKINAPEGLSTRPTLERVKESVFGSIQFDIYGRVVLDLFAGSGNLGIEALSRGAKRAYFSDNDRGCAAIVTENLKTLGFSDRAAVYNADYSAVIERLRADGRKVDLVFLDPPYASGLVQNAMDMLCDKDVLNDGAIIVAEHSEEQVLFVPSVLHVRSEKKYRETVVTLLVFGRT